MDTFLCGAVLRVHLYPSSGQNKRAGYYSLAKSALIRPGWDTADSSPWVFAWAIPPISAVGIPKLIGGVAFLLISQYCRGSTEK